MTRIRLSYVYADKDRHQNIRYYYWRGKGTPKIRLPGQRGSDEFMAAYHACLAGKALPSAKPVAPAMRLAMDSKSVRWLCTQYMAHHVFKGLDVKTRDARRLVLEKMCELQFGETGSRKVGDAPFAGMPSRVVRRIRDLKADTPEAANDWLKTMKALFRWAVAEEHCENDPAKDVPKIQHATEGHHTWTIDEVAQFEAAHPIGTPARLALTLLLYTGCRRADVVSLGPQLIKDGWLTYTQNKNRNTAPVTLSLPVLPELQAVIDGTPCSDLNFLLSRYRRPFTIGAFGDRFREWAKQAGIPHCTPHGLRKAGATRAAQNGANPHELMAIFGWKDIKMAERYTRKVVQKSLAGGAMDKMSDGGKRKTNLSHFRPREK